MKKSYNLAIVGATGLIGRKILDVLQKRNFPINKLGLFASSKSVGKTLTYNSKEHLVQQVDEFSFYGYDLVFFSAGKEVSLKYAPIAINEGAFVIDNSSAFRANEKIPLVVPEINGDILKNCMSKLIANPNCSTAIAILPLKTLDKLFGVKKIIYTTFQAVSGSGQKGIDEFIKNNYDENASFYPADVKKNFIPQIGQPSKYGYTEEELKMIVESKKILGKNVDVSATCVRVPIKNCHGVSVEVELEKDFYDEDLKGIFRQIKGVTVCKLPTPSLSDGIDDVLIGRIKRSLAFKFGLSYFCVGDNTLKGAALNAVQIAESLICYSKL